MRTTLLPNSTCLPTGTDKIFPDSAGPNTSAYIANFSAKSATVKPGELLAFTTFGALGALSGSRSGARLAHSISDLRLGGR